MTVTHSFAAPWKPAAGHKKSEINTQPVVDLPVPCSFGEHDRLLLHGRSHFRRDEAAWRLLEDLPSPKRIGRRTINPCQQPFRPGPTATTVTRIFQVSSLCWKTQPAMTRKSTRYKPARSTRHACFQGRRTEGGVGRNREQRAHMSSSLPELTKKMLDGSL